MAKDSKQKIKQQWGLPKKSRNFDFNLIDQYHYFKDEDETYELNEKTLIDLDFHDYFKFIDRTSSAVGQQYLFYKLMKNCSNNEELEKLEKRISYFNSNPIARLNSQLTLKKLSKSTDFYFPFLIYGELPAKMGHYWIIRLLQILFVLSLFLCIKFPAFLLAIVLIFTVNLALHYLHKSRIGNFTVYFSRLVKLSKTLKGLLTHVPGSTVDHTQLSKDLKQIDKITSQVLFLKTDELQQSEFGTVFWLFFELLKILTLSEIVIFNKLVDRISASKTELENIFRAIGEIDMAISICSLRTGLPYYSNPNFVSERKEIDFEGLYHPLILNCVANDIHLKNKSLLLTGSNMAGKSTFIKAINLNVLSAQVLNTAFGTSYTSPKWKLKTSMTIKDKLDEDSSYYMEEVYSIASLLECSETDEVQYLFTIDEIFKGTNTIERISTAKAILAYLNTSKHLVLVSTHDIELTKMLRTGYDLYYFQENITDQTLSFDYQLKKGTLQKSNAIKILEISGYPTKITEEAKSLAKKLVDEKTGRDSQG